MKLTPKTVIISIIAAPFALINIFLVVATPISIVEALQNPKTFSKASVPPSVTPTPTSESVKKDESVNPETWTSSRPNAMVLESTEVTSMLGERTYSTLRRGQLIRLTGDREVNNVGIEGDYAFFKASGYVNITDIKLMNLLDQAP